MQLGEHARAAGFRHAHLAAAGSTNVEALARDEDRFWVTAGEQLAGKGRRGRDWSSPPGNLYASLCLHAPAEPHRAAQLCFVAALAVGDAVIAAAPRAGAALALKWPNDVLVAGAKIAGILIEGAHGRHFAAVIGCGINIAHHPTGTPYPAADLSETDPAASPENLFAALSDAFARRLAQWDRSRGFAAVRADWLARAAGIGRRIIVRLPSGEIDGVFEALDDDGLLILREDNGTRRPVSAGEVFFPGLASEGTR